MAMNEQDGRDGGWRKLLREWGPRLLLFARQQTSTPAEAEDVVQEAIVRLWRHDRSVSAGDDVPRRLFGMIRRIATDHARKRRRQERKAARWAEAVASEQEGWFEPPGEANERTALLEAALRRLPAPQREAVVLKVWGGLTFEAIGEVLGISPHTAASRYRYALNHLRRALSPVMTT